MDIQVICNLLPKGVNHPDVDVARLRNPACVMQGQILKRALTSLKTGQLESQFHAQKTGNAFQAVFSAADSLAVTTSLI